MNENENNITITEADRQLLAKYHRAAPNIQLAVTTLLGKSGETGVVSINGEEIHVVDILKDRADELQDMIEDASREMSALRGTLAVLRGVREWSEFNEEDLCYLFVNLANQVERITETMIEPAATMAMHLKRDL